MNTLQYLLYFYITTSVRHTKCLELTHTNNLNAKDDHEYLTQNFKSKREVLSNRVSDSENLNRSEQTPVTLNSKLNQSIVPNASVKRSKRHHGSRHPSRESWDVIEWTHSQALDRENRVILRWQPRHQEILFRVEARTLGYIGIGFSPKGGMEGADIAFGWVAADGKAHLMDCHGPPKNQGSTPVRDEIENYTILRGIENDTHTILEFKRVLDTCDPNDYVLTSDTVRVIWAIGPMDPQFYGDFAYHGERRGVQSLHLLEPPMRSANEENFKNWDVTLKNFEVRNTMNTIYFCKIFKSPTLLQKHHIIGYEPLIGNNHTDFVHHMLIHECDLGPEDNIQRWESFSKENGRMCYGSDMPIDWEKCLTPLVAWGVGSRGENFPDNVGLPLTPKKNSFYMLEVHFDNPHMKKAKDTTGLRLHYTNELRENEGGIMITGVALSTLHFIPPMQNEYKTAGYCSTGCTKEVFPKDGVNVVSVMLHSHLAGRKLKLRHLRNGKELPPLAEDNHYDFNYQQTRTLAQNTKIVPGDGLITECTYSTAHRKRPTLGGYSTKDEMCLAFVLHYPRTELAGCYSMPPIQYFFQNLGVKEFYGKNMSDIEKMFLQGESETPISPSTPSTPLFHNNPGDEMSPEANRRAIIALMSAKEFTIEGETTETDSLFDKLIIKEPFEFQNKSFTTHLMNIPYEDEITKKMEEYFYSGLHLTFCRKRDGNLAIKENIEKFPNFTAYIDEDKQMRCSYKLGRSIPLSNNNNHSQRLQPNVILSSMLVLLLCCFLSSQF